MITKNHYFCLVFISSLLFSSIHPLSQDTSITIIREFKSAFQVAKLKIKEIAQEFTQKYDNTFSQAQESQKIYMLVSLFNVLDETKHNEAKNYLAKSPIFQDLISHAELPGLLNKINTISIQTKIFFNIEIPLKSNDCSFYVEKIINVFEKNAKDCLQLFFQWLKESCPELDPHILTD